MLVAVVAALTPSLAAGAEDAELLGADSSTLVREPQILPQLLGEDPLEGLMYADPGEQVDIVAPPEVSQTGDATLEIPMTIPRGRGGVQPDLTLTYDSGAGAGWLGTGWDLDVGSVTVDTRWGVPRYLGDKESETYLLDGEQLGPTAVRGDFEDRVDGRTEFTRRVETQYELVIRHGDSPKNYWWEVRDKSGGIRWYGGHPDGGGPNGDPVEGGPRGLDETAVLRDDEGNIFRWALSAQRDVGVNMVRYRYETVSGERVGADRGDRGRQLYLREILYTAASQGSGQPEDPAYKVKLLRDDDVDGDEPRKDVVVDGGGGFLEVTSDLLRRIEVWTGDPVDGGCLGPDGPDEGTDEEVLDPLCMRDFDTLSRAFDLHYRDGAFGKALLERVDQIDSDGNVYAGNELDYFDEVRDQHGTYDGLETDHDWEAHQDGLGQDLLELFGVSALGASETNAGDARAFLGFGVLPGKTAAIGGSLGVQGGATEGLTELLDINGDGLPDKVFRDGRGTVKFRLNESGPDGPQRFSDDAREIVGLGNLSTEWSIGFGAAAEGYAGATVQFNTGADVSVGEDYFADVNNDGLPDFVSGGRVRFNRLDEHGVPTFSGTSTGTRVPIDDGSLDIGRIDAFDELEEKQRAGSPLEDTVRRWVAPYAGRVKIEGAVLLDPPPDLRPNAPPSYEGDGVRVAVQVGPNELWSHTLDEPGESVTPSGLDDVVVAKGQAVYFRVDSIDHGVGDEVRWDPTITYEDFHGPDDGGRPDSSGRSTRVFRASQDFTLAGIPPQRIPLPLKGRVHFEGVLKKTGPITDDIRVLVARNGVPVIDHVVQDEDVLPDGGLVLQADVDVAEPTDDARDFLTVHVQIDSDVDLEKIDWQPRVYYTAAEREGQPVPVEDASGKKLLELAVLPFVDTYATKSLTGPDYGEEAISDDLRFDVRIVTSGAPVGSEAIFTVKQRSGLKGKLRMTITSDGEDHLTFDDRGVDLDEDEEMWLDISFRDPSAAAAVRSTSVVLHGSDPDEAYHWRHAVWSSGSTDYYPTPYRGWGYGGYDAGGQPADAPLVEEAFSFEDDDFPSELPDTFDTGTALDQPSVDPFFPFHVQRFAADGSVTGVARVWRGSKDNIFGGAGFSSASRKGADDPGAVEQPSVLAGQGARAPRLVGVAAPHFSLLAGVQGFTGTFGAGNSFGLMEYTDMNGDGFPDVVSPEEIEYTGPRGAYRDDGSGLDVVTQDSTFSLGGGFGGSPVSISGNSKGETGTPQNTASSSGGGEGGGADTGNGGTRSAASEYGFNLGGSLGIEASFTNPGSVSEWDDLLDDMPSATPTLEQDLADVNGDGLPDKIFVDGSSGVEVQLNLGYDFTSRIPWADGGGFEGSQSYSGTAGATVGFSYNNLEFGGGLSYNEGVDLSNTSWIDINADGVLDRLRKDGSDIRVAFGSGAGLMDEIDYGAWNDGRIELPLGGVIGAEIGIGEQIAQGRSRGLGGGLDFTVSIPVCPFFCWIVLNPGIHFDHTVSNSVVQVADVNGDGAADSLASDEDHEIKVRLNKLGRTNLLKSVRNTLGGEIRLDYERQGNTPENPASSWALSKVETDDGRRGDGADVQLSTFEYDGGVYDHLEREFLGFRDVVERQRRFTGDGDASDDPVLRSHVQRYRNGNVFESGLMSSEKLVSPGGNTVKETRTTWEVADLENGEPMDLDGADPRAMLELAGAPRRARVEQLFFDADGAERQRTWNTFEYDDLGNVVRQVDVGEPEVASDDLIATTTPSHCGISSSEDLLDAFPCPAPAPAGRVSPLWDPDRCPTWTSLPARFEVRDGTGKLLRKRDGAPALCDNSSVTHLEESTGNGDEVALTELDYDSWGSYAEITYPANADGERQKVTYVYDDHNHANVAHTVDSHGLEATADFDGRTGRIASRIDPNGQKTSYTYDAAGRLESVTGPYEQGTGHPTVSFEYHPDGDYAHAFARHFDAEHPSDPIETVAFVDGLGRTTQTKRDATFHQGVGAAPEDGMIVSGALEFDPLGRQVAEWFQTPETLGRAHLFKTERAGDPPTRTTYSISDRVTQLELPDGAITHTAHGFGGSEALGATVFTATVTDAEGKRRRSYTDARGNLLLADEVPDDAPLRRTRYGYDALGQLTEVTEPGGAVTRHAYDLMGRRTSTDSPDSGLVTQRFDTASNLVGKVTPNLRARGQQIAYGYDVDRLVSVDHPSGTPDAAYGYGAPGAAGNGAGRVVSVGQGARRKALAYDPLGEVADEQVTLLSGAFDANDPRVLGRYRTQFTYDAFGRLQDLTYPDGEVLHHGYNAGGLLDSLDSNHKRRTFRYLDKLEYDEFEARRLQVAGNGVRTTYSYDLIGRPVRQVTDGTSRGEVQDLNHSYDRVGNLRATDNLVPQSGWTAPTRQAYAYDSYHRLSSATGRYGATREYTLDTAYDLAGNVVQKRQSDVFIDPDRPSRRTPVGATSFTSAFTYHPTRVHQITRVNGRNYTHDADGNLTGWYDPERQERLTATWDAADRMRTLRFQGQRASDSRFTYDDEGALVAQDGTGYQHEVINRWFTVPGIDDHRVKHVFAGSDRLATVNHVGTERSAHFLHKNLQGSAQVVTDQRGDLEEVTELFPSGEVWVRQSDETERPVVHQFAGGYLEPTRGVTNLGARWYEPRDGVFWATDPLLTEDPEAAVQNSALLPDYTYAESNPLRLVDSDGLASISALKAYSTAIGAALRPDQPAAAQRRAQAAANVVSLLHRARNASAGQGAAPALQLAAPPPTGLKGRASRLWQRISREDKNPVEGLVDSISAKPLVSFKFKQGEDGWGLSKIKLAPTFGPKQFTVYRKPAATTAAAPAAAAPPAAPAALPAPGSDAGSTALVQRPRAASSAGTQVR